MNRRAIFLCMIACILAKNAQSQTMNIQTQTGITSINVSDIVNITFSDQDNDMITDNDGNTYRTVKIGNQVWMAENLKVTHYRNGDAIPNVTDNSSWSNLTSGAYCNYDNNEEYVITYGRLYNWFAVNDSRGLAPAGWHVPSDAEWQTLADFLGGNAVAGGKMKESGTALWVSPNEGATNESGFTGLPGGYRSFNGNYNYIGYNAYFWSSSESNNYGAWNRELYCHYAVIYRYYNFEHYGYSVRCVRD